MDYNGNKMFFVKVFNFRERFLKCRKRGMEGKDLYYGVVVVVFFKKKRWVEDKLKVVVDMFY